MYISRNILCMYIDKYVLYNIIANIECVNGIALHKQSCLYSDTHAQMHYLYSLILR